MVLVDLAWGDRVAVALGDMPLREAGSLCVLVEAMVSWCQFWKQSNNTPTQTISSVLYYLSIHSYSFSSQGTFRHRDLDYIFRLGRNSSLGFPTEICYKRS